MIEPPSRMAGVAVHAHLQVGRVRAHRPVARAPVRDAGGTTVPPHRHRALARVLRERDLHREVDPLARRHRPDRLHVVALADHVQLAAGDLERERRRPVGRRVVPLQDDLPVARVRGEVVGELRGVADELLVAVDRLGARALRQHLAALAAGAEGELPGLTVRVVRVRDDPRAGSVLDQPVVGAVVEQVGERPGRGVEQGADHGLRPLAGRGGGHRGRRHRHHGQGRRRRGVRAAGHDRGEQARGRRRRRGRLERGGRRHRRAGRGQREERGHPAAADQADRRAQGEAPAARGRLSGPAPTSVVPAAVVGDAVVVGAAVATREVGAAWRPLGGPSAVTVSGTAGRAWRRSRRAGRSTSARSARSPRSTRWPSSRRRGWSRPRRGRPAPWVRGRSGGARSGSWGRRRRRGRERRRRHGARRGAGSRRSSAPRTAQCRGRAGDADGRRRPCVRRYRRAHCRGRCRERGGRGERGGCVVRVGRRRARGRRGSPRRSSRASPGSVRAGVSRPPRGRADRAHVRTDCHPTEASRCFRACPWAERRAPRGGWLLHPACTPPPHAVGRPPGSAPRRSRSGHGVVSARRRRPVRRTAPASQRPHADPPDSPFGACPGRVVAGDPPDLPEMRRSRSASPLAVLRTGEWLGRSSRPDGAWAALSSGSLRFAVRARPIP